MCEEGARPYNYGEWLFTWMPHCFGLIPGIANPTGVILIIVLTVMVICSMPQVRRSGHFEAFAWTHYVSCTTFLFQTDYSARLKACCRLSEQCSKAWQ